MVNGHSYRAVGGLLLALVLAACSDTREPANVTAPRLSVTPAAAPSPLASATYTGTPTLSFWPFTGQNFSGDASDPYAVDPINLLFVGQNDPRQIRAALLSLGGDRTALGFPDAYPFNCVWEDAVGGTPQVVYADGPGWAGTALELQCGGYSEAEPLRFHIRLFQAGAWTIGAAHFEVKVPGTQQHLVLTWEGAEQFVAADLLRSGLVMGSSQTGILDAATTPSFRVFPYPEIYNALPPELRYYLIGSPDPVSAPPPVPNDGKATILELAAGEPAAPGVFRTAYDIAFDQTIPDPVCSTGAMDYIYVKGTISFRQHVNLTPSGNYMSRFDAQGQLAITPVNPLTGDPIGQTYMGKVSERDREMVTDHVTRVSTAQLQVELPAKGADRGRMVLTLRVGPGGATSATAEMRCAP